MPELPEVDHIVRVLDLVCVGKRITAVSVLGPPVIRGTTVPNFVRKVKSKKIISASRRGKFIILRLSDGVAILMHLRMTGSLIYSAPGIRFDAATRAVFKFADGYQLAFHDTRRLGLIGVAAWRTLEEQPELKKLGDDPLNPKFSVDRLGELLSYSRRSVKEFLIDQTRVAGLGNIYAAEALFRARIDPRLRTDRLGKSAPLVERLHRAIMATLRAALAVQSTEPASMEFIGIDPPVNRHPRRSRERFFVYGREGRPCRRCGSRIARIKQGSRSTYFCRNCQR